MADLALSPSVIVRLTLKTIITLVSMACVRLIGSGGSHIGVNIMKTTKSLVLLKDII